MAIEPLSGNASRTELLAVHARLFEELNAERIANDDLEHLAIDRDYTRDVPPKRDNSPDIDDMPWLAEALLNRAFD
jgi:hypothetical protein